MYPSWETTPRNSQGRGSVVCVRSGSPGDVAIVVYDHVHMLVLGLIALFSPHVLG